MVNEVFQTGKRERNSYALYFLGQNLFYSLVASFIQLFFTDNGVAATSVGIIFVIARIWDAVNDPMFGVIVDKSHFKTGKFLPWLKLSNILILVTTLLLFALPTGLSPWAKTAWAGIFYICWGMSYTVSDVPAYAFSTAMTNNIQERTTILSKGRVASNIGVLAVMVGVPLIYPQIGWFATAAIYAVIAILFMIPITKNGKERCTKKEKALTVKQILKYLVSNKYLLIFYSATILLNLTSTTSIMVTYFAGNCLGNIGLATPLLLCAMVGPLLLAIFLPRLTKKMDKFYIYISSVVLTILSSLTLFLVGYENFPLLLLLAFAKGLGLCGNMVMSFLFCADCVEYGTFKTGTRAEGITFSVQTFSSKLLGAISGSIAMFLLAAFGFMEGNNVIQPQSAIDGIWFLFSLFPAIGGILCLPVLFFYRLRDKDVQIMSKVNNKELTMEEAIPLLSKNY